MYNIRVFYERGNTALKIAIVYTTTGGTTKECANLLARQLERHSVTVADMEEGTELSGFDMIVVGFPIRMGKAARRARKFFIDNADILKKSSVGYFICCGFVDCFEDYREKVIPRALAESAFEIACFGGSLEPSRFRGLDRFAVKAVRSEILGGGENGESRADMSLPTIMDENIAQFADRMKKMSEKFAW